MRKIMLRSVPVAVAAAVALGGGEALAGEGITRDVVMLLLFTVTALAVGFLVDAVAGDRGE